MEMIRKAYWESNTVVCKLILTSDFTKDTVLRAVDRIEDMEAKAEIGMNVFSKRIMEVLDVMDVNPYTYVSFEKNKIIITRTMDISVFEPEKNRVFVEKNLKSLGYGTK